MDHPNEIASPLITLMFCDGQGEHPVHSYLRRLVQRGPNSVLGQGSVVTVHLPVDSGSCTLPLVGPPCPHIPIPVRRKEGLEREDPEGHLYSAP